MLSKVIDSCTKLQVLSAHVINEHLYNSIMIRIALLVGLVLLAQSMIPEIRAGLSIETAN